MRVLEIDDLHFQLPNFETILFCTLCLTLLFEDFAFRFTALYSIEAYPIFYEENVLLMYYRVL